MKLTSPSLVKSSAYFASKNLDMEFTYSKKKKKPATMTKESRGRAREGSEGIDEGCSFSLFLKGFPLGSIKNSEEYFYGSPVELYPSLLWENVKEVRISTLLPLENSGLYLDRQDLGNKFTRALTVEGSANISQFDPGALNVSDFAGYCLSRLEAEAKNMTPEARLAHIAAFPMPRPIDSAQGDADLSQELFSLLGHFS